MLQGGHAISKAQQIVAKTSVQILHATYTVCTTKVHKYCCHICTAVSIKHRHLEPFSRSQQSLEKLKHMY